MSASAGMQQNLETNLHLAKALLANLVSQQRSFYGSMGPLAEKQFKHSISLVQTQFRDSILPFLQIVIGILPSQFTSDVDLLKAETLRTVLKIMAQVASVDPLILFCDSNQILDSQRLAQSLEFCLRIVHQDYPVDENANLG